MTGVIVPIDTFTTINNMVLETIWGTDPNIIAYNTTLNGLALK